MFGQSIDNVNSVKAQLGLLNYKGHFFHSLLTHLVSTPDVSLAWFSWSRIFCTPHSNSHLSLHLLHLHILPSHCVITLHIHVKSEFSQTIITYSILRQLGAVAVMDT